MISSIVVTGCYNIGVNDSNKIKINDIILSIDKEIPFVRYRFSDYGDEQLNYIKSMKEKFNKSTHLAEVQLSDNVSTTVSAIKEIADMAVFVYVTITDDVVANGAFDETVVNNVRTLDMNNIDRVCLKDESKSLDTVTSTKLITQLAKVLGIKAQSFALCSSPLSFDGNACLTAVKAREIMSKYNASPDMALPSANHQCMNSCGCIRYILVVSDLEAPAESTKALKKRSEVAKLETTSENKQSKVVKPKKQTIIPGMFKL